MPPVVELEIKAVLKQADELIPSQTMLINTLPLLETKDSSEMENTVATADQPSQYVQCGMRQSAHPISD